MKPREAGSNQEIGNPNTRPLLRRRLLKSMATGGGALVLGIMLPGKWIKPVINIGVLPAHAQTSSGSQQFAATGSSQTFLVPAGVFSVYVELAGGQGGADGSGGQGGQGGTTTGTLSVTPGESLSVLVGQQGSISPGGSRVTGGQSGGGYGGGASSPGPILSGSGGGGTFILRGSTRLLVAGGGGGAGGQGATGGNGGGASGQDGQGLSGNTSYGRGGTPTTGGAAGGSDAAAGTNGSGGDASSTYGGGGGGGHWGGGGSSSINGGGGGGSGYVNPDTSLVQGGVTSLGGNTGDGYANFQWG